MVVATCSCLVVCIVGMHLLYNWCVYKVLEFGRCMNVEKCLYRGGGVCYARVNMYEDSLYANTIFPHSKLL